MLFKWAVTFEQVLELFTRTKTKNMPQHSIYHVKFSTYAKFPKNPFIPNFYEVVTKSLYLDEVLLHLLVSTRAVIGQFSGPYSPVRPAKI